MKEAKKMFFNVLPLLLFAFIIVGFINLLIPEEALKAWLGEEAGWKGLIIGPAIGALIQGGPFAFFPLFDSVFRDNVTIGTAVAMITAWGMINVGHLPYELAFLGPRFIALKYSIYIAIPSLVGLLANLLFG
ncbi:MAG: permease [Bacillota bacterium]